MLKVRARILTIRIVVDLSHSPQPSIGCCTTDHEKSVCEDSGL